MPLAISSNITRCEGGCHEGLWLGCLFIPCGVPTVPRMRLAAQRPDWAPNIGLRGKNPSGCYLVAFMGKSAGVEAIDVGSHEMFEAMNKAIEISRDAPGGGSGLWFLRAARGPPLPERGSPLWESLPRHLAFWSERRQGRRHVWPRTDYFFPMRYENGSADTIG